MCQLQVLQSAIVRFETWQRWKSGRRDYGLVDAGDDQIDSPLGKWPEAQDHTITRCAADGIGTRTLDGRRSFSSSNAVMKRYGGFPRHSALGPGRQ